MTSFLHSSDEATFADEILDQNVLSLSRLRSLIAGDFHLAYLGNDYLLFHEKGIFVLKQCHQNGIIQGSESVPQWTDMNYLGQGCPFANPLLENGIVIEDLSRKLKLPVSDFHSCILFDTQCELRHIPENTERFSILRMDQLEAFFAGFPQRPVRYTHTQLSALNDIFLLVSGEG